MCRLQSKLFLASNCRQTIQRSGPLASRDFVNARNKSRSDAYATSEAGNSLCATLEAAANQACNIRANVSWSSDKALASETRSELKRMKWNWIVMNRLAFSDSRRFMRSWLSLESRLQTQSRRRANKKQMLFSFACKLNLAAKNNELCRKLATPKR